MLLLVTERDPQFHIYWVSLSFRNIQNDVQKRLSYTSSILTELRLALINSGRLDIAKPKEIVGKRKNYR